MYLILLILYIAINLSQGQIIHHFLPNNEDHYDKIRWPSLNVIMHVPTHNGTLKRVPIYTGPTTLRRYMDNKPNRRYYNNNMKNNRNNTPVATETEWAMGRPPGVKFQRPPGVNYANFRPGLNSPLMFNNSNIATTHFNAHRTNKTSFMNVDVAMQPNTNDYYLEHISPDNTSTILFNNTENKANRGTVPRKMYSMHNQGYQRTNGPGNMHDVQSLVNDVLSKYNQTETTNKQNNRNTNRANQYNRLPQYRNNQQYSAYRPTFRPTAYYQQNTRKSPQNYTYHFKENKSFYSGANLNKNQNSDTNNNNQNSGSKKENVPFFWDGTSPMNISITQRDQQNQTLFSYSFDPIQLLPKNITKSISDHKVFTRKRNRVKDAKEASKIWKHLTVNETRSNRRHQNEGSNNQNQNGPQKISLNANGARYSYMGHPVIEYESRNDESSEFLGYFPKNNPRIEDKNDLEALFSNVAEKTFSEQNEDLDDEQDNDSNNMLVITPIKKNLEEQINKTGKFIFMKLKKPPSKSSNNPSDFKSKVEPLIITSIYRHFLTDLKKNLSNTGVSKQKLHFSFKLGPGYLNKELKPQNITAEEIFDSDYEQYD